MERAIESHELIAILDFGSQYTHLIARRLRECGVYCELLAHDTKAAAVRALNAKGVILSGGPYSVYDTGAPHVDVEMLELGIPVLGICYGLQEMVRVCGGRVTAGSTREFGRAPLTVVAECKLFDDVPQESEVWMSHVDEASEMPKNMCVVATSGNSMCGAAMDETKDLYGLQFHPEVTHSAHGAIMLRNFAQGICGCKGDWSMRAFADEAVKAIQVAVGEEAHVVGAVSGGVDSTVAAALVARAVGDRFHAVLVDNGLLRMNEAEEVTKRLRGRCGVQLSVVNAQERFLKALEGVTEPERKRRIIGMSFISEFEVEADRINAQYLLQGTLYPDVIESASHKGAAATIKTHHNVGGLPERMRLKLLEPLRYLFKDEVRALGLELGIERESIFRHPFPGPGLAIRILGEVSDARLKALRNADQIFLQELRDAALYDEIAQAFAVLLPVKAVGVMGDSRTYEEVITLRAVKSSDFMTADWFEFPTPFLRRVSTRIVNEVAGINRVTYDITSKPPGTIEWE